MLGKSWEPWRSLAPDGWVLDLRWADDERRSLMTFTARRSDVSGKGGPEREEETNWTIMNEFDDENTELVCLYSLVPLLAIYTERIAQLRDSAGRPHRIRHLVKEARELDRFLIADGLDAASLAQDIQERAKNGKLLRYGLADYVENLHSSSQAQVQVVRHLVPDLLEWLNKLSGKVVNDAEATLANVRASAELRQSISNTRWQRIASSLALLALAAAVASIMIAVHQSQ